MVSWRWLTIYRAVWQRSAMFRAGQYSAVGKPCKHILQQHCRVQQICACHWLQGQGFDRVVIDLQSCRGTEALYILYVMVSHMTSLDSLLILRFFDKRKVTCAQSENAQQENKHIQFLNLLTMQKYGTASEKASANAFLPTESSERCAVHIPDDALNDTQALIESVWLIERDVDWYNGQESTVLKIDHGSAAASSSHGERQLTHGDNYADSSNSSVKQWRFD